MLIQSRRIISSSWEPAPSVCSIGAASRHGEGRACDREPCAVPLHGWRSTRSSSRAPRDRTPHPAPLQVLHDLGHTISPAPQHSSLCCSILPPSSTLPHLLRLQHILPLTLIFWSTWRGGAARAGASHRFCNRGGHLCESDDASGNVSSTQPQQSVFSRLPSLPRRTKLLPH